MRAEQIFQKVKKHLLKQGFPAKRDGQCVYRGSNGQKCAIGCLIPYRAYDGKIEGNSVSVLQTTRRNWVAAPGYQSKYIDALANVLNKSKIPATAKTRSLLIDLQVVHDNLDPEDWETALEDVRKKHFARKRKAAK